MCVCMCVCVYIEYNIYDNSVKIKINKFDIPVTWADLS